MQLLRPICILRMIKLRDKLFGTLLSFLILNQIILIRSEESCYNNLGLPKRCSPDFINVAYERPVFATNTCGKLILFI
jgi:hypothetical protein